MSTRACAGDTCQRASSRPRAHPVSTGGRNLSVRGCGSRDLCGDPAGTKRLWALPGHRLASPPDCSSSQRAVIDSTCHSGAAPGLRLALPVLVAQLVATALP